ncbi:hypothetical protein FA15DRAFT_704272 [Coprinopsis marcescibilis]|uniref:MYND-type domain-containing protein n=1 Tax=Coprinopsis marcescibilis TaxID=230819 RepID=A0A5C3KYB8_COPMA|nr:hypothetical protein FA15DRAFT_704272 [Coprinopsis marcescibilis]
MTQDGGLERLVRMLHDYCISPTPPENPSLIYGLTPPNIRPPKPVPTLNPTSFDKHAAYRFSLAFQCVVNIGVRGSEHIRSRVVQAGTLDVVGCVLEAWLASKGFAVGPSSSATGLPRETREQRQARKAAQLEARQREEAAQLQKALQRQLMMDQRLLRQENRTVRPDDAMDISASPSPGSGSLIDSSSHASTPGANSDNDMSTDNSMTTTPQGSGTPTSSVVIPNRDRSGTLTGRPWADNSASTSRHRSRSHRNNASSTTSTDVSRPETETEDDGDAEADVDMDGGDSSQERAPRRIPLTARRPVGIVSADQPPDPDAHIIVTDGGVGVGVDVEVGVEDGLVSLGNNDDFAMGAPPGAPGAINDGPPAHPLILETGRRRNTIDAPDVTPRAGFIGLPGVTEPSTIQGVHSQATGAQIATPIAHQRTATIRGRHNDLTPGPSAHMLNRTSSHYREVESGPYRDEDVLLGLQLLAYLSKYPHVRQAFYKPRVTFHPASVNYTGARASTTTIPPPPAREKEKQKESTSSVKDGSSFFRTFTQAATGNRGKERAVTAPPSQTRQTNVFSLVERFTFKPSSTETELPNPPPRLPPEIQYWAGVIMRNACRKDDSRGGIRQCANMLCGRWESYPREFAKCRRCRKAKYCGKECQSTAWSEGHRFWCSARDTEEDGPLDHHGPGILINGESNSSPVAVQVASSGSRSDRRDRERLGRELRGEGSDYSSRTTRPAGGSGASASGTSRIEGMSRERIVPSHGSGRQRNHRASSNTNTSTTTNTSTAIGGTINNFLAFAGRPADNSFEHHPNSFRRRAETITPAHVGREDVPPNVVVERNGRAHLDTRSVDPLQPGPSRRGGVGPHRTNRNDGDSEDMVLG